LLKRVEQRNNETRGLKGTFSGGLPGGLILSKYRIPRNVSIKHKQHKINEFRILALTTSGSETRLVGRDFLALHVARRRTVQ